MTAYKRSYNTLNHCLLALEAESGMARLNLNEDGFCYFSIGNSPFICMYLLPNGEHIQLSAFVFEHELFLRPKDLHQLLAWNYSSDFLHNSIIGFCTITQRITLKLSIHMHRVDEINLFNICQNFGADLIKLQEKINQMAHGQSNSSNTTTSKSTHQHSHQPSTSKFWMAV